MCTRVKQWMTMPLTSVILAGGVGTRLWPLSRTYYPKQFIKREGRSLFQEAYARALLLSPPDEIWVVTSEIHQYLVKSQIEELGYAPSESQILKERVGRNTLPAISWAMREIHSRFGDSSAVIFSSDHHIGDGVIGDIRRAEPLAREYLVTFGVRPTGPNTGYGYIASGKPLAVGAEVREFREKPDRETACRYVEAGYLWNSGMFLFSSGVFFSELERHNPEIAAAFAGPSLDYTSLPSISVDYGLLERSDKVAVVPLTTDWTDLGTFRAWYECAVQDAEGNAGEADFIDSSGNFVYSPGKKAALIGVHDTVVVDTGDALLVCDTRETERVKELVRMYQDEKNPITDYHLQVFRPWGSYTELERSNYFRIKRVTVKPGKKLSLQLHRHRSEHWIVVSGMADVILDGKTLHLRQGESTFVQAGVQHRLGNSGKIPLEVIEVQIGEYLEEDDIVRFSDDFNRV
jgi:mannose-1-phosphate guanylyltransferase/mannose-6-phosphate isomerase